MGKAEAIVAGLGGAANIVEIEPCATRLRSEVHDPGKVDHVQLLGTDEKLTYRQTAEGLRIEMPKRYKPAVDYAAAFKIFLA